ncbi:transcriptional regulator, AraC family [Treponema primitia ZAS-2]|uniref:Transcriptional regulator, AraC family n=1 Tax=Treponema primitia (strain ATCC BAA-887 / DSM 12427 / ZAS-2) TaxID=545694 RepID=F5YJL1_TREPZ|nr:AraC family transcriptional regulator [Treponema primitia]AEF86717.1 transcriptional regulator, AraC family [Treponema primitia ZAS-2]
MTLNNSNIILRREIEPMLLKARSALQSYEKATGVNVSVLDQAGHSISEEMAQPPEEGRVVAALLATKSPAQETLRLKSALQAADQVGDPSFFCALCRKYSRQDDRVWDDDEYPCTAIHIHSISQAQHAGGVYIYTCEMGFAYWTCPLSTGGRLAGALIAGRVLGVKRQEAVEKIFTMSRGLISREESAGYLEYVPEKSQDEIKSLAQLLLTCAEQISRSPETYHEILKRRAQQQTKLLDQIETLKNQYPSGELVPCYPIEKERLLMASLRRGDNESSRKVLDELLALLFFSNPDNFKFMQYRAIELVVLLSRAAVTSGNTEDALLEMNNQFLLDIQEAQNMEELIDMLYQVVDSMTGQIFSFRGVRHASALRKAERYIWENYTRKLSLQEVATASGLSAPYFSTVFKEEMGENLSGYLNRLRVERAAAMLSGSDFPLSEIAGACGFEDQSWFSKIFKNYTGMSPGKYRIQNCGSGPALSTDNLPVNHHTIGG